MANDTAKTQTTNLLPVQGIFGPLPPYPCITLIGPAGEPFYAPTNPNLDGVNITNSTINSTTIGLTAPAAGVFTNVDTTTGTISSSPTGPTSIVNQAYVDAVAQGLSFKQPANYTTTGNITLSGLGTQAGGDWASSLTAGMRVLVKNQTAGAENGIYIAASGPWTRSADANTWDELVSAYLFIISGTTLGGSAWVDTNAPGGTLGVTPVTFVQFSNNAIYTAGTGLTLSGFQFSITNTGVTAGSYGSASNTLTAQVNAQGQLTSLSATPIAIANTQVSGLGSMSTQNANNVAITGGSIDGTTIGGSTAAAITGTTITANTQFSGSGAGLTGTASGLSIGGNAATATSATTATNLAGGAAGYLPYQSAAGTTTFLVPGTNGQVLTLSSGVPVWSTPTVYGDVVGPSSATDNAIARFDTTSGKLIQNSLITLSDAGALQNVNEINWDTTPTAVAGGAGSMAWNSGDGTLDLQLNADVTIQLGQENIVKVYNNSVSTITNGSVVAVNGAQGQRPAVVLADADSEPLSAGTLGIATEDIAAGAEGFVCTFGTIRGVDTSGFTAGNPIYLSQTAGQFTATRPAAPAHTVFLGWVIKVNASSGEVFVHISNGWELDELHNVKITNVQNNDLLQYNSSGPYWQNIAASSTLVGKATNLAGGGAGQVPYQSAADTTAFLAAGSAGQVLTSNGTSAPTWTTPTAYATVTDDTTTNATRYPLFANQTAGNLTTEYVSSTKLQFNPSTGILTATSFSGAGTGLTGTATSLSIGGNAATATSATTATNLAGGANGSIPYQTASGTTTFLAAGSNDQVLTLASGVPTWASPDPAGITVTDDTTTNATRYITFTSATTGSILGENVSSTKLQFNPSTGILTASGFSGPLNGTVGATTPTTATFTDVTLNAQGDLRFADADSSNWVAFQSPATVSANVTWTLPSADGTNGQALITNGSGTLSWANATGDVVGPASATDNAVARFDGTTGKLIQNSAVTIADTTGDVTTSGYVYTANGAVTTPSYSASGDTNTGVYFPVADEVAVSAGGSVAAAFNSHQFMGMRNRIINGNFSVAQRGTSFIAGANNDDTYNLDRWYVLSDGNDTVDITQNTAAADSNDKYCIALDVETINKKFGIAQIIENINCFDAIGKTVTLSFKAKVSATTKLDNVKCAIVAWSGTADTVTSDIISAWNVEGTNPTLIANATYENTPANLNITTSWATYTVSAAVDTASTSNILVFIWSDVTDTTLGDFLYITNVQLEIGSVATPFERRPFTTEIQLCQRYYAKTYDLDTAPATVTSAGTLRTIATSTGVAQLTWCLPVEMRDNPTVTIYNSSDGGTGDWRDGGGTDRTVTAASIGTRNISFSSTTVAASSSINGHAVAEIEL